MEKNSVLMLLFMSFHFTQFCAFIAYSFVFMGYYLWFIEAKVHNFSEVQGNWCVFLWIYLFWALWLLSMMP